ncbi:MAG TPA: hypothetical protein VH834_07630 [Solirubrobacteraceae bacterium]
MQRRAEGRQRLVVAGAGPVEQVEAQGDAAAAGTGEAQRVLRARRRRVEEVEFVVARGGHRVAGLLSHRDEGSSQHAPAARDEQPHRWRRPN